VLLYSDRCIMCTRCVRFTREVTGTGELLVQGRGGTEEIDVFPGVALDNELSGNVIDICPVGALLDKDFIFQQRVWFLTETNSICTGCGRGCNMEIGARGDTIYRQTPRDNNDVNSTWMCDSGRLDFHFVNSEFRLTDPMVKTGGKHNIATWKAALSNIATALAGKKGEEIAIIASARMTNEELFFVKHLAAQLGTTNVDVIPRTGGSDNYLRADDLNPNTNGAKLILGIEPGAKLAEIQEKMSRGLLRGVLALGENLLKVGFAQRDLEKVPFIATLHLLANASAELSNVVLPGTAYAEKRGSMINVTGRLQRLNKAVKAPGNAHDTWEILRDLIVALGGSNGIHTIEDVFKRLAAEVPALNGLTFSKIGDQGVQVLETVEKIPLLEREKERKAKGIIVG
jgi:NADH-quinone oxidoreductase subunit G